MWENIKKRLSSKTYRVALLLSILGVVEMNFPLLQPMLGEYYGVTYIAVAAVFMILRELTKESIEDKGK